MFNPITEIIQDIKAGKQVIIVDDEDRENEGDLVMAAESATPEAVNFMAKHGRGLICVPMEGSRLDVLGVYPMSAERGSDQYNTNWAVSVDARKDVTTGISAHDRSRTIKTLIDSETKPTDLIKPGHIFPLRAKEGGVLMRAGHTEAAVDLARLAGLYPAGVICEIMNEDGTMARVLELIEFAKKHDLKIGKIADLIRYRRKEEKLVRKITQTILPTEFGEFDLMVYESLIDNAHHVILKKGEISNDKPVLVRVHSQCLTGDVFGSLRCDCGAQLKEAMKKISALGSGVILYMRQEGRGIGLANKLKAYALQDSGLDTVEANEALGFEPDLRDYGAGAQILVDLGIKNIRLLTNNPQKIVGLEGYGLKVVERLSIEIEPHECNSKYLRTKKEKLGHELEKI